MSFSPKTKETLLVACHRHCSICHEPSGIKMEIHHITPKAEGGDDSLDNGIPLCFDCHAEVGAYNDQHPKGTKFTPSELRRHRDQWFTIMKSPPWAPTPTVVELPAQTTPAPVGEVLTRVREENLWDPDVRAVFVPTVVTLGAAGRRALVEGLEKLLSEGDDAVRWNAAIIVEELVEWDPQIVTSELLERMAVDTFFSVRSSAAVSYYHLAGTAPNEVPIMTLGTLALWNEDWYVTTPATSAMLRLARTRTAAIDLLAAGLSETHEDAVLHSVEALERLARVAPGVLRHDIAELLSHNDHPEAKRVGSLWETTIEERRTSGEALDFSPF